ncbi:flavodoxin family protein [Frateuria defendens]|uniref:flavodoxin family protein n=1 Tax=Frateuria defendens TaxID=2219559 RepID=UPI00066FF9A1|nr:flavodoxin [Frateuria defendens]
MTSRTLLVYYSMTGNTRKLAEEIGDAVGADVEEIRELHARHGLSGMWRAMVDTLLHREPALLPVQHDPADYDLLVLGGPVWASHAASPVRAYARQWGEKTKDVALFCTEGRRGAEEAFAELRPFFHRLPVATVAVDAGHLRPGDHREAMQQFVAHLKTPPSTSAYSPPT